MNSFTREIKAKGYTLRQGLKALGISLSTYRKYEKLDHKSHGDLAIWINELEQK